MIIECEPPPVEAGYRVPESLVGRSPFLQLSHRSRCVDDGGLNQSMLTVTERLIGDSSVMMSDVNFERGYGVPRALLRQVRKRRD